MNITALALSNFILMAYPKSHITPMKLQKLAYYVKVWSVISQQATVRAQFHKWKFGPVNYKIFKRYQRYSKQAIPPPSMAEATGWNAHDEDTRYFLHFILRNYIDKTAVSLSALTHQELPWAELKANTVISDALIQQHYSDHPFAKNFDDGNWKNGDFTVVKDNDWHAFVLDMKQEDASFYEREPFLNNEQQARKVDDEFDEFLKDFPA